MKFHRIWAIVLRYLYLFKHSLDRQSDLFYWPTVDLILWGLTSSYFSRLSPNGVSFVAMIISGIILWVIVWRGQYEITVNLLEEFWNKNLINIFVSPIKFTEWILAFVTLGVIKAVASGLFATTVAWVLYKVNFFVYGFYLIPFSLLLIMTGWWVGFFVAGFILRFGSRFQHFAWSMVYLIAPFSAIYYPLSILPEWAQRISAFVPTSYIFEGARGVISTGQLDPNKLWASFGLNLIYLALSLVFLRTSFNKLLRKGLEKLY